MHYWRYIGVYRSLHYIAARLHYLDTPYVGLQLYIFFKFSSPWQWQWVEASNLVLFQKDWLVPFYLAWSLECKAYCGVIKGAFHNYPFELGGERCCKWWSPTRRPLRHHNNRLCNLMLLTISSRSICGHRASKSRALP